MANVEINDLPSKATPVVTDELEIQETAGGDSKKVTLQDILDDVIGQTGTFSPMLTDASKDTGEGQTASVQDGRYQKIGDWCHFTLTLTMTSIGTLTPSFNSYILDMPFDAAGQAYQHVAGAVLSGAPEASQTEVYGRIPDGESYIELQYGRTALNPAWLPVSGIGASGTIIISGKYRTA